MPLFNRSDVVFHTRTVATATVEISRLEEDTSSRTCFYIISAFLSAASLYVMVALAVHRWRVYQNNKKEAKKLHNKGSIRNKPIKGSTSPWLDNLSLLAAIFAFLNCFSDHPVVYLKNSSDETCKVVQSFSFLFYSAGIACLYSFLWLRQRACYKSPTLAKMHNKFSRVLSSLILPVFLVMMVAGMILTAALWTFETSTDGCVETSDIRAPLVVLYSGSVAMQITLLSLFLYPLKRHTLATQDSMPADKLLAALVKRSMITTGLCVFVDTLAFILTMTLFHSVSFIIINYIYDANLICNVICIVGSFADWRQRVGLCCVKYPKKTNEHRLTLKRLTSRSRSSSTTSTRKKQTSVKAMTAA